MAESVDALVSNTSNSNVVPVRPRLWVQKNSIQTLTREELGFVVLGRCGERGLVVSLTWMAEPSDSRLVIFRQETDNSYKTPFSLFGFSFFKTQA